MTTTMRCPWLAALCLVPLPLAAQTPSVIPMEEEPHHRLILKNNVVNVYMIDLAPHDAFVLHHHDHDVIDVLLRDATTVSASPGQADVLTISNPGDVRFSRSGKTHSVRNIGQNPYSLTSVDLLHNQTGARNLCGKQIPDSAVNCPPVATNTSAPRVDMPQFETDQTHVTLTRIRPHRQAAFGETDLDDLIVTIDGAEISAAKGKGPDEKLIPGEPVWLARGSARRNLKNDSDKEMSVVIFAFRP